MAERIVHQPLALVPNASHLSFQLYAWSPLAKKDNPDQKLLTAITTAYAWLRTRFRNITDTPAEIVLPENPDIDALKPFQIDNGYYLSVAFNKEKRKWAFRLIEPDMGPNPGKTYNRTSVPGRLYQTDVAFSLTKDKLECGFKTQCIQPINCEEMDWEVFRLKMVKMLISNIGLEHVKPLKTEPYRGLSVSSISSLINNPSRQIPVILVTQETIEAKVQKNELPTLGQVSISLAALGETEKRLSRHLELQSVAKKYIDVDSIAARTVGFAHTCFISTTDIKPLAYRIGRDLSPKGGEIAVIMPVRCYPENDWIYSSQAIRSHGNEIGEEGEPLSGYAAFEQAFVTRLSKVTKQNLCIKYGRLMFLNEIRLHENQQYSAEDDYKARVSELEKECYQNRQIISDLQRKNGGLENAWAEMAAKNRNLAASLMETKDSVYKDTLKLQHDLSAKKDEAVSLRDEIVYLASKPFRYKDVAEWVEQRFHNTLILTQKAQAALRAGEYENVPLLCDAVRCLAIYFIDFASKKILFDDFSARLKACGLEYRGDNTEEAKKTYISYRPEYPEGSGRFIELKMHLRANTDKSYDKHDQRGVLRIYFTYDEELKKVIIHHLPSHLPK